MFSGVAVPPSMYGNGSWYREPFVIEWIDKVPVFGPFIGINLTIPAKPRPTWEIKFIPGRVVGSSPFHRVQRLPQERRLKEHVRQTADKTAMVDAAPERDKTSDGVVCIICMCEFAVVIVPYKFHILVGIGI
jgi:hypothetical protein